MVEAAKIDKRLESYWIPKLVRAWRVSTGRSGPADTLTSAEIEQVGQAIRELSRGLVGERELIGRSYLSDPASLGAYLLYFWPVSYAQARRIYAHIPELSGRALDLGAGPGPLGFAASDEGVDAVTMLERAPQAITIIDSIARDAGVSVETGRVDLHQPLEVDGDFGVVTMGHVLNELWGRDEGAVERRVALCERAMESLRPGGHLVIMEPALRETSRELLQVRDALVERGHQIAAPCFWAGACPALERERDWCHAEFPWEQPRLVQALARKAGLKKHTLKMTYLVVRPSRDVPVERALNSEQRWRIVSEPLHSKGRFHFMGCGARGRVGLTLLKRNKWRENKVFAKLDRWDVVDIDGVEERGGELRLAPESSVDVVLSSDELEHWRGDRG